MRLFDVRPFRATVLGINRIIDVDAQFRCEEFREAESSGT